MFSCFLFPERFTVRLPKFHWRPANQPASRWFDSCFYAAQRKAAPWHHSCWEESLLGRPPPLGWQEDVLGKPEPSWPSPGSSRQVSGSGPSEVTFCLQQQYRKSPPSTDTVSDPCFLLWLGKGKGKWAERGDEKFLFCNPIN